jgi:non-heme chloroperoxidase
MNQIAASGRFGPWPNLIQTRDGTGLFYKTWGDGKPVLFVHAGGLPSDMWHYQMVPLSEHGVACVAYDRRGHGRSGDPGRGYDFDTLADDLAAVIEALDLREVTLVGHSFASGEMVRYLTRHGPGRIARLVFVAPAATPFRLRTADNPDGIEASVFEQLRRDLLLKDHPQWLEDNARPFVVAETSRGMIDWLKGLMLQTSMKALVDCNRAMVETDFRAELPRISLPTLVIHGDRDVSAPVDATGRRTAELIPGAVFKLYEGAPHGLFVTHMERLNADLLAFIGTAAHVSVVSAQLQESRTGAS